MKIAVHAAYGTSSEETGVIFLLAKYLNRFFPDMIQLRCSGAFSHCDRDAESQWKRGLETCFKCMHEQKELSGWADLRLLDLTSYLSASEVLETRKWISYASTEELLQSTYDGIQPSELIGGSFKNRFGVETPNLANRNHEQVARRYMLAALRTSLAAKTFAAKEQPDLTFIAGADDFISRSTMEQLKAAKLQSVVFYWDLAGHVIKIVHPRVNSVYSCGIVIEGLSSMRSDVKTWPTELLSMIDEIISFLEIDIHQIPVRVAR